MGLSGNRILKAFVLMMALTSITGCVSPIFDINVKNPGTSDIAYQNTQSQLTKINYSNHRNKTEIMGKGPVLTFNLKQKNAPLSEIEYLITNTQKELNNRGVNVALIKDGQATGKAQIKINSLKMTNHRVNGFSPLVTLTSLSADLEYRGKSHRLVSFVKRGKVPMWTLTEEPIVKNVFNQPLAILVQDFASGINRHIFGYKVSDADVNELIKKINSAGNNADNYLSVYKLGFTNNPKAIDTLAQLTRSPDEYIRLAAISSLGTLQAANQVPLLKKLYASSKLWQERGMILKSMGNIGTKEAMDFLKAQLDKINKSSSAKKEQTWSRDIIKLFL